MCGGGTTNLTLAAGKPHQFVVQLSKCTDPGTQCPAFPYTSTALHFQISDPRQGGVIVLQANFPIVYTFTR